MFSFLFYRQGEEWGKLRKIIASKLLPPVKLKYYYEDFSLVANDAIEVMNVCRNSDGVVEDARDIIERWSMESESVVNFTILIFRPFSY